MEEIKYKLNSDNVITITQAMSKLIELIKSKINISQQNKKSIEILELNLLREKCADKRSIVSSTACQGLVHLTLEGYLSTKSTLFDLTLIITTPNFRNYSEINKGIFQILLYDMIGKTKEYSYQFNLLSSQHPMITILKNNQNTWEDILNEINFLLSHTKNKIETNIISMLKPFLQYVLYNPTMELNDNIKINLLDTLIPLYNNNSHQLFLFETLPWLQFENITSKSKFYSKFTEIALLNNDTTFLIAILPLLVEIVNQLIKNNSDPRLIFNLITKVLNQLNIDDSLNLIQIILAEIVLICPFVHLDQLIELCEYITIKNPNCNKLIEIMLHNSVLQWISINSTCLVKKTLTKIEHFLKLLNQSLNSTKKVEKLIIIKTDRLYAENKWFIVFKTAEPNLNRIFELNQLINLFKNENDILDWLRFSQNMHDCQLKNYFLLLSSFFILNNKEINQKSLIMIKNLVSFGNNYSSYLLIILINKLSQIIDADLKLDILLAIPEMAVLKENINLILYVIEILKSDSNSLPSIFQMTALEMYLILWKKEARCYRYLHKALIESPKQEEFTVEFNLTKARILKEICIHRPEQYGTELVSHLSNILTHSSDEYGQVSTAIALEAIILLCKEEIVSLRSTWNELKTKFSKDNRKYPLESLCHLLNETPNLVPSKIENEVFYQDVMLTLWAFALHNNHLIVKKAALNSLKKFNIFKLSITKKEIPESFMNISFQIKKSTVKIEDEIVPGECWIEMLFQLDENVLSDGGDLLITWIEMELAEYRSGVYKVAQGEPSVYSSLPAISVLKAVGNFVKYNFNNLEEPKQRVFKECLRILSYDYQKSLLPLNWNFLLEFWHRSVVEKQYCFAIASKQSIISHSAKGIVENYLGTFKIDDNKNSWEIISIKRNFKHLCKSIEAKLLKPVLLQLTNLALDKYKNSDDIYFKSLIEVLKDTFQISDILEENKEMILNVLEMLFENIEIDSQIFDNYINCLILLPPSIIERVCSPSVCWEVTDQYFHRAIKTRCEIALRIKIEPLTWLNECVDTAVKEIKQQNFVLEQISKVISKCTNEISSPKWYLNLMSRIQSLITTQIEDLENVEFLSDLFIIVTISFTSYYYLIDIKKILIRRGITLDDQQVPEFESKIDNECFINNNEIKNQLFTVALNELIEMHAWSNIISQIMEFVFYMSMCDKIPKTHRNVYKCCRGLFKINKCYKNNWMKYISSFHY